MVHRVFKARKVNKESKVSRGRKVSKDSKDYKVIKVKKETKVIPVMLVLRQRYLLEQPPQEKPELRLLLQMLGLLPMQF